MINLDDRFITETMPIIGAKATVILLAIAKHLDVNKKAFPSKYTIQKYTGLGRDAVTNGINLLVENDILEKKQRRNGARQSSNLYSVKCNYLTVYVKANKSFQPTESQPTESQPTESQPTENPLLSINKKGSINKEKSINKEEVKFSFEINSKKWSKEQRDKGFELFWEKYDLKQSKGVAKVSWYKVCKNGNAKKAFDGIDAYKKHLSVETWKRTKMVSTWLNQESWDDEYKGIIKTNNLGKQKFQHFGINHLNNNLADDRYYFINRLQELNKFRKESIKKTLENKVLGLGIVSDQEKYLFIIKNFSKQDFHLK